MPLNPIFNKFLKTDFHSLYSLSISQLRDYYQKSWDDFKGETMPVNSVVNRIVKTKKRDTPVRIYYPDMNGPYPVFIWIHGGGFILGSIDVYDSICRKITNSVNCAVLSIDYGLAPEYKFPNQPEECYQVTKWTYEHAEELHIQPNNIAMGGDSVGGTLTAVIAQLSRNRGEFPLVYQVEINAMFDLLGQTRPVSRVENAKGYRLQTEEIENYYVPKYLNSLLEASDPLASPLLADNFADLAPACIITSEYDPLRDEGESYAKKLSEADVSVCLKRYDGIIHGFFNMQQTLPEARDALDLVCKNLKSAFISKR